MLSNANTYRGTTYVPQGVVLVIENGQALGGPGITEEQTITVPSTVGTTFSLSFNGISSSPIPYTATRHRGHGHPEQLQATNSIGGSAGTVSVAYGGTAGVFTVSFGGTLLGFNEPLLTGSSAFITVAMTQDGGGGTMVANGASLELEGNITVDKRARRDPGQRHSNAHPGADAMVELGPRRS